MEFLNVIKTRRSTRKFSQKPVDKNLINELIDSARFAPSAGNRQNWLYIILEHDKKDTIANIMLKQINKDFELNKIKYATLSNSIINSIRVIKEVPILILVFRDYDKDWTESDYLSIGATIENICLRATDLGSASLWIRDVIYAKKEIQDFIIDDNKELVSAIAIGYGTEFPYKRKKKSLKNIMIWK